MDGTDPSRHGREVAYIVRYAMKHGDVGTKDEFASWLDKQVFLLGRNAPSAKLKNARWPQDPVVVRLAKMLASAEGTRSTLDLKL